MYIDCQILRLETIALPLRSLLRANQTLVSTSSTFHWGYLVIRHWGDLKGWVIFFLGECCKILKHQVQGICGQVHRLKKPMVKICPEIINFLFFAQNLLKFAQKKNLPKIKKFLPKFKNYTLFSVPEIT